VAVLVSIARGHSACYQFTTVGAADGATITGERGVGYYLSAMEKVGEPRLDLGRQRRRRAWLPRQGHGAARGLRRAAARPGAHLARCRARDTARPHANRPARGTDAKPRTGRRRDTRAGLGRRAGWLPSHSELTHAQERAAMAAGLAQAQEARSAWTARTWCTPLSRTCPTTRTARTRRPRARQLAPGEQAEHLPGPEGKRYATPRSCPSDSNCSPTRTQKACRSLRTNGPPRCSGVGHRWSDSPCHRGPDHGAGLHKGHVG
jgi:hypothetical protein